MAIIKDQELTFMEWLQQVTKPKRRTYIIANNKVAYRIQDWAFDESVREFIVGVRKSFPTYMIFCPESNCKMLIQIGKQKVMNRPRKRSDWN